MTDKKKTEEMIYLDFVKWSDRMEKKYDLNAVDVEDVIRRHLNRIQKWAVKMANNLDKLPEVEVPEKYRNTDWLRRITEQEKYLCPSCHESRLDSDGCCPYCGYGRR